MNEKDFAKEPHSKKRLHIIIEIRVKEFFLCIHIDFACIVFKNYINYGTFVLGIFIQSLYHWLLS